MFEPRAVICATVVAILASLMTDDWREISVLAVILLITLLLSHVPVNRIRRNLLMVAWLALFTLGAHLFGGERAGQPLQQALHAGGMAASRLFLVVGWGTLLGHSASPLALAAALERLLTPLRRLGLPVQSFSLVAMLSMRFLPILLHEQQMIVRTHIARGIDVTHASRITRMKLYVLMCVPILTHLLRRVEHLSAAMESRAFQAQASRTVLKHTHLRSVDYALMGGSALLFSGITFI